MATIRDVMQARKPNAMVVKSANPTPTPAPAAAAPKPQTMNPIGALASAGASGATYAALSGGGGAAAAPAVPVLVGAGHAAAAAPAAPVLVSGTAPGVFAAGGTAATAGGVAAGAATGYEQWQDAKDITSGKAPDPLEAAAAFPVDGGASLAISLGSALGLPFGHSEHYYDGKDREGFVNHYGPDGGLTFQGPDGKPTTITADQFRHDQTTYNYDQSSATHDQDIGLGNALAYLTTGDFDGKKKDDVTGMIANLHKNGLDAGSIAKTFGYDHDSAYGKIEQDRVDGKLTSEQADILKNGLDSAFGTGSYGSPADSSGGGSSGGRGHHKPPRGNGLETAAPTLGDVIPKPNPPPVMPDPDASPPSPSQQSAVNDYAASLRQVLERKRRILSGGLQSAQR